MQGFLKTLFGDKRNFIIAAVNVIAVFLILRTPAADFAGLILPAGVLYGAAYLAKY